MAYNISVAMPASQPEERWRWVKNGYELLRDRGIELNPRDMVLYRQLAFIFQHKIGGVSDDAHKYYKLQLAKAMEPLLGPADNAYFQELAAAPSSWAQLMQDADVADYVAKLKQADQKFADADSFISNYLSLIQNPARFDPRAFEVRDSFRGTKALEKLDTFARAYQLRTVWKLDPVLMEELNKTYGPVDWSDPNVHLPLDWRHPDTHAMYWAIKGLRVAGKKGVETPGEDEYSLDEINTDRLVNHSLQDLFRNGRIYIYKAPPDSSASDSDQQPEPRETIFLRPDLRMFEPYDRHVRQVIAKYVDPNDDQMRSHQIGHRNMLKNAVFVFYQAGHKAQARRIYSQLRRLYPDKEFDVPLAAFVRNRLLETLKALDIFGVTQVVLTFLRESYFYYALREDDEAAGRENMAKEIYELYNEKTSEKTRINLPELGRLRYLALQDFLQDGQYPVSLRRSLLGRIRLERPDLYRLLEQQEQQLLKDSARGAD